MVSYEEQNHIFYKYLYVPNNKKKRAVVQVQQYLKLVCVVVSKYILKHGWISILLDMNSFFGDAKEEKNDSKSLGNLIRGWIKNRNDTLQHFFSIIP
jgi:hypothetical protein